MKWIRRIHMYLGLFMMPWVLLYAVTGLLFNHSTWFADHSIEHVAAAEFPESLVDLLPPADDVASQVVAHLNQRDESASEEDQERPMLHLRDPSAARYIGNMAFNSRTDSTRYRVDVSLQDGSGMLHAWPVGTSISTPVDGVDSFAIDVSPKDQLVALAEQFFTRRDTVARDSESAWGPTVKFQVAADGEPWIVHYDLSGGHVSSRPAAGWPGTTSVRNFLTSLHLTRGYPIDTGMRSIWPVLVDLMASALVLWVLSGLLMWWQMRVVRLAGSIVLAISALWATGLGFVMYEVFRH